MVGRSSSRLLLLLLSAAVIAALLASASAAAPVAISDPGWDAAVQWVEQHGGKVDTYLGVNANGIRGMFVKRAAKEGEHVATIPSVCILNVGSIVDSFVVQTLRALSELKNEHSRFKPYIKTWPKENGVLSACNMPPEYFKYYKSDYWLHSIKSWQDNLHYLYNKSLNPQAELTIAEAVGATPVTFEELKYACAISSTRALTAGKRLILAPIFDMSNHDRNCIHTINKYDEDDVLHVIAGKDMEPGDELCYKYGDLRDDESLSYYGFLPAVEDPPRLAMVDHHMFQPNGSTTDEESLPESRFSGTHDETLAEITRMQAILNDLRSTPMPPPPEHDHGFPNLYDTFVELDRRRQTALAYEIHRLTTLLPTLLEIQQKGQHPSDFDLEGGYDDEDLAEEEEQDGEAGERQEL